MQIIVLKVINTKNETMNKKSQHVVPHGNQWAVKGANNEKATKVVDTQREAIKIAREIAINQQTELVVHGKNGQIRVKNSYGNDPADIKG